MIFFLFDFLQYRLAKMDRWMLSTLTLKLAKLTSFLQNCSFSSLRMMRAADVVVSIHHQCESKSLSASQKMVSSINPSF